MHVTHDTDTYHIGAQKRNYAQFQLPKLGSLTPTVTISEIDEGWQRVRMRWELGETVQQDELAIAFQLGLDPDFWWAPHLAPEEEDCIGQHVFRSPALIVSEGPDTLVLVPDLDICGNRNENPWFMDVDAPAKTLWLGMTRTTIPRHVEYRKVPGMTFESGSVELGFFVTAYRDEETPRNPWGRVGRLLWERYGHDLLMQNQPHSVPMDRYVQHVYRWAFETWGHAVSQSFELDGRTVGAPVFIVNVTQSPNYPDEVNMREFLSIWNQAWFSSLRSASGLYRYAKRTGDESLRQKALQTKELALCAPMHDGIFPSVYRAEMMQVEIEGKSYNRTKGWDTGYWTNSNRVPWERGVTDHWYHILDASWTALLMLRWYEELDSDAHLIAHAKRYADKLLTLQDEDGFFPGWLHPETLEPAEALGQSPETSMSVTFLLKLAELTGESEYQDAAVRAMDAVLVDIVPSGRWEDFETYWSCCGFGKEEYYGKKILRNAMYKQCNFSMFWTAEALLACYRATGESAYLKWGHRTLDELSMMQQVWQPPFIYIPALGGFGVMNFDGEWNDSRQCLFAELFMQYYEETGEPSLFERGIAALKSAFVMMYCPENPEVKALWERTWPFFGPEDYGFTMENYAHGGHATPEGEGMGEFTIYDWGNGAAAEARNRIRDHFGDVYIHRGYGDVFGIDSIQVEMREDSVLLTDPTGSQREVRVVFEDGSDQIIHFSPGRSSVTLSP